MSLQVGIWDNKNLIKILKENGIVVMPTDTIYGIVGRAQNKSVVDRIYEIKKRNIKKPFIILIGDIKELKQFSIILSKKQKNKIKEYWPAFAEASAGKPAPTSIVFDCSDDKFEYLHRGTKTLAFRVPYQQHLRDLLTKVGPLVAPSANIEGLPPAKTVLEAKEYFGDSVDLYLDGGKLARHASRVVRLHTDGTIDILRK